VTLAASSPAQEFDVIQEVATASRMMPGETYCIKAYPAGIALHLLLTVCLHQAALEAAGGCLGLSGAVALAESCTELRHCCFAAQIAMRAVSSQHCFAALSLVPTAALHAA